MQELTEMMDNITITPSITPHTIDIVTNIIKTQYNKKQKRDIWENSKWKEISKLENDDVGKVGEQIIHDLCKLSNVDASIDGMKTKKRGGGEGDGIINGKTCEIKTARLGSSGKSFQHELGEVPWIADYMIFLDITPDKMYITIFPNFNREFYIKSGKSRSKKKTKNVKCKPYFPTRKICWRKKKGAFKLDTSIKINESNKNKYTFVIDDDTNHKEFNAFVNSIIEPVCVPVPVPQ
jgi:hypothetical protein